MLLWIRCSYFRNSQILKITTNLVILPHLISIPTTRRWGIKLRVYLLHFALCPPSPPSSPRSTSLLSPVSRLFFRPPYQNAKRYGWQSLSFRMVYMECIPPSSPVRTTSFIFMLCQWRIHALLNTTFMIVNHSHSCYVMYLRKLCIMRVVWPCIFIMKWSEMPTWCNNVIYWSFLSSTCFGRICRLSGAIDVKLQHMVFCTGFWKGDGLESRCVGRVYGADGALRHMLQLNIYCSWWSAYAPETCRAKKTSINYIVASSWHFALFHVHCAFDTRSEPSVSEVTSTHSQERWPCSSDILSGFWHGKC